MRALKHGHFVSTIFGRPFLKRLLSQGPNELARTLELADVSFDAGQTIAQIYQSIYALLLRHYRCEYIYKNALAAKILLARHSPRTASLLTEVQVGEAQADIVILNGSSIAYEIKTELDTLRRLPSQVEIYKKAFEQVYLVGHDCHREALLACAAPDVGIIVLTSRYTLHEVRKACPSIASLDKPTLFEFLRRPEYEAIIGRQFGAVPDVPNTRIYRECQELFLSLPVAIAHFEVIQALRRRSVWSAAAGRLRALPHSLALHGVIGTFNDCGLQSLALPLPVL